MRYTGKVELKIPLPKHSIVCDAPSKAEEVGRGQGPIKSEEVKEKWANLPIKTLPTATPSTKTHLMRETQDGQVTTTSPTTTTASRTLRPSHWRNSSSQLSKFLFTTRARIMKEEVKSTINKISLWLSTTCLPERIRIPTTTIKTPTFPKAEAEDRSREPRRAQAKGDPSFYILNRIYNIDKLRKEWRR